MQKSTLERRSEKAREALDMDKSMQSKMMCRSTTPQSNDPASHSLSSVDEVSKEEDDEEEVVRHGRVSVTFYNNYDEEENIQTDNHYPRSKPDCDGSTMDGETTDNEMPPAVAAQREFLARLEARHLRQQCCQCKCCCECCRNCCARCADLCSCCPNKLPRCNPCRYASYYYAALVLACAVCGAIFVSVGALQNNRQYLIAGSILCITSFGLFLHRCFRKSPYQPKGYPGFIDEEDFSSLGSGECSGIPAHYKGLPPIVGPGAPPGNALPSIADRACNSYPRRPSLAYDPTVRRTSAASMAHSLGCVSNSNTETNALNHYQRKRNSTTSGILNLARRLSVANNHTPQFNEGWQTHGHLRHKYRRSCSYPWAMARPEHHYVEYV